MSWLEKWAMWQVIAFYIGIGILGLIFLILIIYGLVKFISYEYKKHSKKYHWNCIINKYVKDEDDYNGII